MRAAASVLIGFAAWAALCCTSKQPRTAAGAAQPSAAASVGAKPTECRSITAHGRTICADTQQEDAKFQIEGPFYVNDPVHETITLLAVQDSKYAQVDSLDGVTELIRGIFWNDDPCGQLFDSTEHLKKSKGYEWWRDFSNAEDLAKANQPFATLHCPILGRSHFGDLQFFHAMASTDGVPAKETLERVIRWAHFTYEVSLGTIDAMDPLEEAAPEVAAFIKLQPGTPLKDLFSASSRGSAQERALGSMLHLVQDSFAAGHTNRKVVAGSRRAIIQFYSYTEQDHTKHGDDDAFHGGGGPREHIRTLKGGPEALSACITVLQMRKTGKPWSDVEKYLTDGPLALAESPLPSGPGEAYQKH